MSAQTPDESLTPDPQGRMHGHLGDWYQPPPNYSNDASTWRPERLSHYLDRQRFGFVSPRQDARDLVRDYVERHLGEDIEPDDLLITTLYINELHAAPHPANIACSMTLTDAAVRNWQQNGNGRFLDHLSHLREYREGGYPAIISSSPLQLWDCFAYEAIYRKTSPQRFDQSTHVALDPKAFKQFVWDADIQTHFQRSVDHFWEDRRSTYHLLIKAALLRSAYVQHAEGSLITDSKILVLRALGLSPDQSWDELTLEHFTNAPLSTDFTFHQLVLYRYVATDIIVIRYSLTDELVMYVPGNSSPLHVFEDLGALAEWVALQCKDTRRRQALEAHFRLEDDPDGLWLSGIGTTLAGLAAFPHYLNGAAGYWRPNEMVKLSPAIVPWPFSHIQREIEERNVSDGRFLIRTRADYNKEAAAQVLTDAVTVMGGIAMAIPALWAPLAAMSLALAGLGVDEVVEGVSLDEKKNGVGRIIFGVLNAVPAAVEGASAASDLVGSALHTENEVIAGAADEVGQMVTSRNDAERSEAIAQGDNHTAQTTSDRQERASEADADRQQRLVQEERQRQAQHAHHQATYDSVIAFGVEPEGLRSLSPELRAGLANFEYDSPLDSSGAWGVNDFGAVYTVTEQETGTASYFARVHAKIYRVEPVEGARQYRIFSLQDPNIKGPYIKRIKGYYSDIDLKPGLRGGESLIEVLPESEPVPEIVKPDIVLAPGQQVPTIIEIPMDGVEVRPGFDGNHRPADQYFAMDTRSGTPVRYDADIGCWRKNEVELIWRNNKGAWKSGSEQDYLKVRDRLRFGVRSEIYKFPLLPGLPLESEVVDLNVHQIWLGDRLPRKNLIETMKANMTLNPKVKFTFHIDIESNEVLEHLLPKARLQAEFAEFENVTISDLQDEPFFEGFTQHVQTAEPFYYFRYGNGQNLAAASDVLRYRLIHEYGGIYMDCDDVMTVSFEGAELKAGQSDVLVGMPMFSPRTDFFGPANSHFASLPGNPVLREMQQELFVRFQAEREVLGRLKGAETDPASGINPYMLKIFEVTGPRFFLDMIKKMRPDYVGILDETFRMKPGIRSIIFSEFIDDLTDFYAPFKHRLPIRAGTENSWVGSAG